MKRSKIIRKLKKEIIDLEYKLLEHKDNSLFVIKTRSRILALKKCILMMGE